MERGLSGARKETFICLMTVLWRAELRAMRRCQKADLPGGKRESSTKSSNAE